MPALCLQSTSFFSGTEHLLLDVMQNNFRLHFIPNGFLPVPSKKIFLLPDYPGFGLCPFYLG